jgi:hypothetical protein
MNNNYNDSDDEIGLSVEENLGNIDKPTKQRLSKARREQAISLYKRGQIDSEYNVSVRNDGAFVVRARKSPIKSNKYQSRNESCVINPNINYNFNPLEQQQQYIPQQQQMQQQIQQQQMQQQQPNIVNVNDNNPNHSNHSNHNEIPAVTYFNNQNTVNQSLLNQLNELRTLYSKLEDKYVEKKRKKAFKEEIVGEKVKDKTISPNVGDNNVKVKKSKKIIKEETQQIQQQQLKQDNDEPTDEEIEEYFRQNPLEYQKLLQELEPQPQIQQQQQQQYFPQQRRRTKIIDIHNY